MTLHPHKKIGKKPRYRRCGYCKWKIEGKTELEMRMCTDCRNARDYCQGSYFQEYLDIIKAASKKK